MSLKTFFLSALPAFTLAVPEVSSVKTLGQLEAPAFFENIAVRQNGAVLATLLAGGPDVYTVTNPSSPDASFELLTSIPAVHGFTGIAEVIDENGKGLDKWVVTGANSTSQLPSDIIHGSWSAWLISFEDDEVTTEKISDLSADTALSNGMVAVPNGLLFADSYRGAVSRLDLTTFDFEDSIISVPEMETTPDFELGIGINGIKIFDNQLYFSNTALGSIYRLPITEQGYPDLSCSDSSVELVANVSSVAPAVDDFEIVENGDIFLTTNYINLLLYVDGQTGEFEVLTGAADEFTVAGGSAAAFGRTAEDKGTLYVSTATATIGNQTEGGRVLAVEF